MCACRKQEDVAVMVKQSSAASKLQTSAGLGAMVAGTAVVVSTLCRCDPLGKAAGAARHGSEQYALQYALPAGLNGLAAAFRRM